MRFRVFQYAILNMHMPNTGTQRLIKRNKIFSMPKIAVLHVPNQTEARCILQRIADLPQQRQRIEVSMHLQKHLHRGGGAQRRRIGAQRGQTLSHAAHHIFMRFAVRERIAKHADKRNFQLRAKLQRAPALLQSIPILYCVVKPYRSSHTAQRDTVFIQQASGGIVIFRQHARKLFRSQLAPHAAQFHCAVSHSVRIFYNLLKAPIRTS